MRRTLLIIGASLLIAASAMAQETTGGLRGFITSQDGATLPGVTVTIRNLATGLRLIEVTTLAGEFRFAQLPPGRYELNATLDGFQTYKQTVDVDLGATPTVSFVMALGAVTDVIEVSATAPLVDVTSTVSGITVSTDELNARVPILREATQVALLAPATMAGDNAFDGTVSGNRTYTPGQRVVSMGGNSVAENSYQVNGLNLTNFRNGLGANFVPFEFMQEVQVKTGGYEAEFGRATGGVINMITKSGSNLFRGDVNAYYMPESLQEMRPSTYLAYNEAGQFDELEANASVGGPIVQDKLFFFAFVDYTDRTDWQMEESRGTQQSVATPYWGGKIDWNLASNHRFEATYFTDDTTVDTAQYEYSPELGFGDRTGVGELQRGGENYIARYTGILTPDLLVSLQYGKNNFDRTDASSGDVHPAAYDSTGDSLTYIGNWVNFQASAAEDERDAYRGDVDYFLGKHSLRGGLDYEKNVSADETFYSGHIYYRYYLNQGSFPQLPDDAMIVRVRQYESGGSYETYSNAAYLQDSWAIRPNLTLNLGVRWEAFDNRNAAGESYIKISDQYAPRLGVVWDPGSDGKSKVYASYGLYHLPIASNTNIRLAGLEFFDEAWYEVEGGGWNDDGTPIGMGQLLEYQLISDGVIPDSRETKSNKLDPMAQFEAIIGYERMIGDKWSVGARFVNREFDKVIEDITIDEALWTVYGVECYNPDSPDFGSCAHEYRVTNPGEDFQGWYDVDGDGELDPISFTAAESRYPKPERKYYAVELTVNRRFSDNWMLQGSYTWSHSYGNYEGYVNSDLGQDDAGLTESFDFAGIMDHAYGNLPNDRRHNVKVFGAYAFDFGLQVGANAWFRSGRPVNGFGVHPDDPWAAQNDNYSFYSNGVPCPRGCGGTTPDVWNLDLSFKYQFRVAGLDLSVRADVFNVLDLDEVTQVNEFAEQASGAPNTNYLQPTEYQNPRRVRFGLGISF